MRRSLLKFDGLCMLRFVLKPVCLKLTEWRSGLTVGLCAGGLLIGMLVRADAQPAATPAARPAAGAKGNPPDLRCGAFCVYISLKGLNFPAASLEEILSKLGPASPAGYSFAELETCAKSYGAQTLGVSTSFENLQRRQRPFACIARLKTGHFVNIIDIAGGAATLIDPPLKKVVPLTTLASQWDNTALLVSTEDLESEESLIPGWSWKLVALGGLLAFGSAGLAWWGFGRKPNSEPVAAAR